MLGTYALPTGYIDYPMTQVGLAKGAEGNERQGKASLSILVTLWTCTLEKRVVLFSELV